MINNTRLSQASLSASHRLNKDETKSLENTLPIPNDPNSSKESLLSKESLNLNSGNFASSNSFNELLQMSTFDKSKNTEVTKGDHASYKEDKKNQQDHVANQKSKPEKKQMKETASKSPKSKNPKNEDVKEEQKTLTQLLAVNQPQNSLSENGQVNQDKRETENNKSSKAGLHINTEQQINLLSNNEVNPNAKNVLNDTQNNSEKKSVNANNSLAGSNDLKSSDLNKQQSLFQNTELKSKSDTDNLSALKDILKTIGHEPKEKLSDVAPLSTKSEFNQDDLSELASKFDQVNFDFKTAGNQNSNTPRASEIARELQAMELAQKLAEQEWQQNDLTLKDMLSHTAQENAMLEQLTLDRLEAMGRLKDIQQDKIQMQSLQAAALERQLQNLETQSVRQQQWKSLDDLSPDQLAIIDALKGMNQQNNLGQNPQGNQTSNSAGPLGRLLGSESNVSASKALPQETHGNLGTATSARNEGQNGNTPGGQSGSMGNPDRGTTSSLGGISSNQPESKKIGSELDQLNERAQNKANREQEKAREMARAAALRAQSIASELANKGGGSARVQIKDAQLGVVELRINMSDNNRMNVELVANTERIKQELEKQSEDLKSNLEKNRVVVDGVQFTTDSKLGESNFQSESRNQQQQPQQQQQSPGSFSQNNSSQGQQGSPQDRLFEMPQAPNSPLISKNSARKNYSGKNDLQTNVQRDANGSLKVSA